MSLRSPFSIALLVATFALLTGCSDAPADADSESGKLVVVCTTTMIADTARHIAGEHAEVVSIMRTGEDPHVYEVRPRDAQAVKSADLVLFNGLHLEATLLNIIEDADTTTVALAESDGITVLQDAAGNSGGAVDPHCWMNVTYFKVYASAARDAMVNVDPDNADTYRKNAEHYLAKLDELHAWALEKVEEVPRAQRVMITSHDAFRYLGDAYGIDVHAIIGISTEQDPRPQDIEKLIEGLDDDGNAGNGGASPGAFAQDSGASALVDIDDLDPVRQDQEQIVDIEEVTGDDDGAAQQPTFFYDQQRGEWVRIPGTEQPTTVPSRAGGGGERENLVVERVIEVDYRRLVHGDSSLNIVVRPNDRVFVEPPRQGVVYVDGEVVRRGVYNLPTTGELTLSRLIAAAGGLNAIAIPERVDLTRRVGNNREATVRLNLAAIRNRTEPDIFIKPDDTVIVGTNWIASPLAVLRNGFRATYGFGFLLDRNFGPDVFGPTPIDRGF